MNSPLKKRISSLLALPLFIVAIMSMTGCEKDYNYVAPKNTNTGGGGGTSPTVFFTADIQPIFTAKCAVSGCHNGNIDPNLSAGQAYDALTTAMLVNTAEPANSELYKRITLPTSDPAFMPEGQAPLSDDQKAKILTWITEGAHNN